MFIGQTISLLTMTGYQKTVAVVFAFFSITNIGLNFILIQIMGHEGASIAS
jgi:O-antigen/teichoic acid export membrane protein